MFIIIIIIIKVFRWFQISDVELYSDKLRFLSIYCIFPIDFLSGSSSEFPLQASCALRDTPYTYSRTSAYLVMIASCVYLSDTDAGIGIPVEWIIGCWWSIRNHSKN